MSVNFIPNTHLNLIRTLHNATDLPRRIAYEISLYCDEEQLPTSARVTPLYYKVFDPISNRTTRILGDIHEAPVDSKVIFYRVIADFSKTELTISVEGDLAPGADFIEQVQKDHINRVKRLYDLTEIELDKALSSIWDYYPLETIKQVKEAINKTPNFSKKQKKVVLLTTLLYLPTKLGAGYKSPEIPLSASWSLQHYATKKAKKISYLDSQKSIVTGLAFFRTFLLRETFLHKRKVVSNMEVYEAVLMGDLKRLDSYNFPPLAERDAWRRSFLRKVFFNRNLRFSEQIFQSTLNIVGASHLVDDPHVPANKGLLSLLRDKGYQVTREE